MMTTDSAIDTFAMESLSSPQLMQSLCLDLCRSKGIDDSLPHMTEIPVGRPEMAHILESVATASSCQTALDILTKGLRVRGTERKTYRLNDGQTGDVYTVVLKAIACDQPRLSITYSEIRERVQKVTDGEPPSVSSLVSTLTQMDEAAQNMRHGDRVLEWDSEKETLNFPDP